MRSAEVVRARQSSVWIDGYRQLYAAIDAAADLLSQLSTIDFTISAFDEGLERYRTDWFRIDQLYRQFTYARRSFEGPSPLDALRDLVEKTLHQQVRLRARQRLAEAGRRSNQLAVGRPALPALVLRRLRRASSLREDKKAVVIVSDALRYEVADELRSRIRQEDRFNADLDAVLGVLPSYTQLGMAALLPHRTLKHSADGKTVLADGLPTNGVGPRSKVLETVGGSAIQAEDLPGPDRRRAAGHVQEQPGSVHLPRRHRRDRRQAGHRAPGLRSRRADALAELVDLVKKTANANATNIFVTADHGFLFQDEALPEQFFLSEKAHGDKILVSNKRYVLGHGLKVDDAFTTFTAEQLNLDGDIEVQIPKSIHRLRLAGGGTRFVHGGATLQEIVVPVLVINKKRKSDTRLVNVKVLPGHRQDHHRPAGREAVPVGARQRQGSGPRAARGAVRGGDADLQRPAARADLRLLLARAA
ncbi:MAG: BREX-1 system phosphatase PglZ type A [Nocardioides sp.]